MMLAILNEIKVIKRIYASFYEGFVVGPDLSQAFCSLDCKVLGDDREGFEVVDVLYVERMLMHEL